MEKGADFSIKNKNGYNLLGSFKSEQAAISIVSYLYSHYSRVTFERFNRAAMSDEGLQRDKPIVCKLLEMLQYEQSIQAVHIHLCGNGCSGKTTMRRSLEQTLKHHSRWGWLMSIFSGPPRDVGDISLKDGRTIGLESGSFEHNGVQFVLHDFGGQEQFYVNHCSFLAAPGSLYVIVAALWDYDDQPLDDKYAGMLMDMDKIFERYTYWLRLISSCTSDAVLNIVTVINFKDKADRKCRGRSAAVQAMIGDVQRAWKESFAASHEGQRSIVFHTQPSSSSTSSLTGGGGPRDLPIAIDVKKSSQVWNTVNKLILDTVTLSSSVSTSEGKKASSPVPRCLGEVLLSKSQWPKVLSRDEFNARFVVPALRKICGDTVSLERDMPVDFLVNEAVWRGLLALDEVVVVDARWVVTDLNWLTSKVLGEIVKKVQNPFKQTLRKCVLSAREIDECSGGGSSLFDGDLNVLPRLLASVGACISLGGDGAGGQAGGGGGGGGDSKWFPSFLGDERHFGKDAFDGYVREFTGRRQHSRRIKRRFALKDPTHQMFPPGYFGKLLAEIAQLEGSSINIEMYDNGMAWERMYTETGPTAGDTSRSW